VPALTNMRLRPATLADLELLRRWDEAPHIIEAKGTEDWQWEREFALEEEWREQLIAEVDGQPIGFIQIIDPAREQTHYWGECPANLRAVDIWIGEAASCTLVRVDICEAARRHARMPVARDHSTPTGTTMNP